MNFSEFYPIRCLENREEDLVSGTVMELLAEEDHCDLLLDLVFDTMQEHLRAALGAHARAQNKSVDALTEEEIAKKLGYANHSAVSKRIKKIQKACRAFLKERTNMAS